jgi:Glycosyl transferase family 11
MKNYQTSKNKITCNLTGRLGNNLFQIAYCTAVSIDNDLDFFVNSTHPGVYHEYKNNILKNIQYLNIDVLDYTDVSVSHNYNAIKIPANKNLILTGYGQTDKYFSHHKSLICSMFGPTDEFIEKNQYLISNNTTAIHIRRGDYLYYPNIHPVISIDYIKYCTKLINSDSYIICSDDIDWCKSNIDLPNITFIENEEPWEALWILSICNNFILSNSSFSWWSAYLSKKQGKVLMPSTWFGPDSNLTSVDMVCEGWNVIPTYFDNGQIKV